jgi:hypothetical protein
MVTQFAHEVTNGARLRLALILAGFMAAFWLAAGVIARQAVSLATAQGLAADVEDIYLLAFCYSLLLFLLSALPLLLLLGYRDFKGAVIAERIAADLSACGFDDVELGLRLHEHAKRSGLSAFLLPMLLNLLLLYLAWTITLLPRGLDGLFADICHDNAPRMGLAAVFTRIGEDATPLTWLLLGIYFYSINVLLRRWIQSDLTTGTIWWINVRLAGGLLLGLLLTAVAAGEDAGGLGAGGALFAFTVGVVPDALVRRSFRQAARLLGRRNGVDPVPVMPLRASLKGLSFWQAERLAEQGIESVQDLALADIPSLIVQTCFDTPQLVGWIDRALLRDAAGRYASALERARILTASQLVALAGNVHGVADIAEAVAEAVEASAATEASGRSRNRRPPKPPSELPVPPAALLGNIIATLEGGPNLGTVFHYRRRMGWATATDNHEDWERRTDRTAGAGSADADNALSVPAPGWSGPARARGRAGHRRQRTLLPPRTPLFMLLLILVGLMLLAAHVFGQQALATLNADAVALTPAEVYTFAFKYSLLFFLLVNLPLLMVIGYRDVRGAVLRVDLRRALAQLGLDRRTIGRLMREYEQHQGMAALLLPLATNVGLLLVIWLMVLLPDGLQGAFAQLRQQGEVGAALLLTDAARGATPHIWVLLGAYYYGIGALLHRWLRSDLSADAVWAFNVRLAVAFVIGLLVMALQRFTSAELGALDPRLAGAAFAIGMTPDLLLRWLFRGPGHGGLFGGEGTPSDPRVLLPGLSLWQRDRLLLAGVEDIDDLAMLQLPRLMLRTRFDRALLLRWVDRALVCVQAGPLLERFRRARLDTATTLTRCATDAAGRARVLGTLNGHGASAQTPPLSPAVLGTMLDGLAAQPNLRYLQTYAADVGRPAPRPHAT